MSKYSTSDEEFIAAVEGAKSYTEIFRRLGQRGGGGSTIVLKRRIKELGLETPDLIGVRGVGHNPRPKGFYRKDIVDMTDNAAIKSRLIFEGVLKNKCSRCSLTEWLGEILPLELDHIDGDNTNNKINNLRLLCPNCHSLTPTWRGRNRKWKEDQNEPS